VIESVIEFGALWKEVNPAAIFISALQFIQPSDWSRFLLLVFILFIFPHSLYFIYFLALALLYLFLALALNYLFPRTRFTFIYFLALALNYLLSALALLLFTFRTRTTFIYFNALLLYHV
jgi:hypothetical protein